MSYVTQKLFWEVPYENSPTRLRCQQCVVKTYDNQTRTLTTAEQIRSTYLLALVQSNEPDEVSRISPPAEPTPTETLRPQKPKQLPTLQEEASIERYPVRPSEDRSCQTLAEENEDERLGQTESLTQIQAENDDLRELLKMQNKEKCYLKNKLKSFYEAEQAFRDHAQDIICQYQKREAMCKHIHRKIICRMQCDKEAKIDQLICRIAELLQQLQAKSEYIRYCESVNQIQRDSMEEAAGARQEEAQLTCDEMKTENDSLLQQIKDLKNQNEQLKNTNKELDKKVSETTAKSASKPGSAQQSKTSFQTAKSTSAPGTTPASASVTSAADAKCCAELETVKKQLAELQISSEKAIREQLAEVSRLLEAIKGKEDEIKSIQNEIKEKEAELKNKDAEIAKTGSTQADTEKQVKDKEDLLAKLKEELANAKSASSADSKDKDDIISKLKAELNNQITPSQLASKDDEIAKLRDQLNQLNEDLANSKKSCEDMVEELKGAIDEVKKENATLQSEVKNVENLKAQVTLLKESQASAQPPPVPVSAAEAEIADLKAALAKYEGESPGGVEGSASADGVDCAELARENEALKAKIDEFRKGMANLECKYKNVLTKFQNSDCIPDGEDGATANDNMTYGQLMEQYNQLLEKQKTCEDTLKKDRATSIRLSAFGESGKDDSINDENKMQNEKTNGVDTAGELNKIDDLYNEDTLEKCRKEFEKMSSENSHLKNKLKSMQEEINEQKKQLTTLQQRQQKSITPDGEYGSQTLLPENEKYFAEQDVDGMDINSGGSKSRFDEEGSTGSDQIKGLCEELALLQLENDRLIAENEALRLINDSLPSCDSELAKLELEVERLRCENCRLQERCRRLHEKLLNLGVQCDDTYNKCMKKAQDLSRSVKTAPANVQIPCKIFDTTSLLHDIAETKKLSRAINEAYFEERLNQSGSKIAHQHICGTGVNFKVGVTKHEFTTRDFPLQPPVLGNVFTNPSTSFTPPVRDRSSTSTAVPRRSTNSTGKRTVHKDTNIELNLDAGLKLKTRHYETKKSRKK